MSTSSVRPQILRPLIPPAAGLLLLAACSSGGSSGGSSVVSSAFGIDGATAPVRVSGRLIAYLAHEMTTGPLPGSDLNGDGDRTDEIAVVIDMGAFTETSLGVAAKDVVIAGSEVYVVVDEAADGRNWETPSDLGTNTVLLNWSQASGVLTYVDTLAGDTLAVVDTRVFYASATVAPAMANESSVSVIDAVAAPLMGAALATDDTGGALEPLVLGQDEGLVLLTLDEAVAGRDLNGDGDMTDGFVLALLDGSTTTGTIRNTGLALEDAAAPVRAHSLGSGDWLVACLVSEAAQGGVSLNDFNDFDPAWLPTQCPATADTDTTDQVLFYLYYAAWAADPVMNPPRNTGLAGTGRALALSAYVGTVSPEADDGCDLNNDGDTTDDVFRWAQAVSNPASPVLPVGDVAFMHALFAVQGGTGGAAELQNRWVIDVDEADDSRDLDGEGMMTHTLIGWDNPAAMGLDFTFDQNPGGLPSYASVTWMVEELDRMRLPVAFAEAFTGATNGDGDQLDSFPSWSSFNGNDLVFPGVTRAVSAANAGVIVSKGIAFYRVDEAADGRDWNNDGDMTDFVLFRTSLNTFFTAYVGVMTNDVRLAIDTDQVMTPFGGAFIASEADAGVDYNGDGDMTDDVLRYLRF
jgi:hypothetical protein